VPDAFGIMDSPAVFRNRQIDKQTLFILATMCYIIYKTKNVVIIKGDQTMTITKELNGTELKIAVEGRLDTMTAPELEAELNQNLGNAESLTLDFSKLEYISSAGLRVLLSAHKIMSSKGGMKVTHVNEIVSEVFEVTGFADILTIE